MAYQNKFIPFAVLALLHAASSQAAPNPLRNAYYGDLHTHTTLSFDAYIMFGTTTTPEQAYRFARGEAVDYLGKPAKRDVPLDFQAVTDHSENLGVFNTLDDPNSEFSKTELGQALRKVGKGDIKVWELIFPYFKTGTELPGVDRKAIAKSTWERLIDAANQHYQPGKFTTLIGYEWTSHPDNQNLHRNVIFRGNNVPDRPFSSYESRNPEDLWAFLNNIRKQGQEGLAIPHNANASNGLMYSWNDGQGKPIDEAYAQQRVLNEPISEITQNKGSSDTHPSLSGNDEFANFEIFDTLLTGPQKSEPQGSYVRDALGKGLVIKTQTGANPYQFGVIGSTDFHNGLSTGAENSYGGYLGGVDPTRLGESNNPDNILKNGLLSTISPLRTGSGGLAGVWAEENTREGIYDALRRKEVFATSGSRLKFRFFGGWDYDRQLVKADNWVQTAYSQGVSMGGDLPAKPTTAKAPRFVAWGLKDPDSGNLDRLQVIKLWAKDGKYQEKIFDVALSDGRKRDPATGLVPPVGNTVNLKTASYANSIGDAELGTVWEDPEFDPSVPAVYYLRVLEIPTPRWSTILAVKSGAPIPDNAPAIIQERGWSSPIWYYPRG